MSRFADLLAQTAQNNIMWFPGLDPSGSDQLITGSTGTGVKNHPTTFLGQARSWIQVRRTGGAAGFWGQRFHQINPYWLLNAALSVPYTFRLSAFAVTDHTTDDSEVFWGIGSWWDATQASLHGIGFRATNGGNWFAVVIDDNTVHLDVDTGVASGNTVAHDLEIQLDGATNKVSLLVDGTLVGSVTFTAVTPLEQIWDEPEWAPVGPSIWCDATPGVGYIYFGTGRNQTASIVMGVSDVVVVPPVISSRITYQRILNLARTRAPEFVGLVIDDQQIMDELNGLTLELIQEGSDADHSTFQEVVNWLTDVFPSLPVEDPPLTDLRDFDSILVPSWVNTVYAIEGIQLNGDKKVRIDVDTKESQIRDRPFEDESILYGHLDGRSVRPRALKVWDSAEAVWRYYKNTDNTSPSSNSWTNIYDANLVVSGVRLPMSTRADLTDAIPVPFRALKPLTEAYALILGGRAGKDVGWVNNQRVVVETQFEKFREWINVQDMSTDEPFDPEIGMP